MRQISNKTLGRLSNDWYSLESMTELLGNQPHMMAGYIRHKRQFSLGLMTITEGLGAVWQKDDLMRSSKAEELLSYQFSWDVETSQIPTVRISRSNTDSGAGGVLFNIHVADKYFAKYDVFALRDGSLLYVKEHPEKTVNGDIKLTVQSLTGNAIDVRYTAVNETLRYTHNLHPEYSSQGSIKHHYNMERHTNFMMKIRASQNYSNDFRAVQEKYFVTDKDANYMQTHGKVPQGLKVFKMNSIEEQVIDHFLKSVNGACLFNESSIDEKTLRSRIQIDNDQDLLAGDGIIPQYQRYAFYIDYPQNGLNIRHFQDSIENIREKRGKSMGNHITVICNRRFSNQKARALENGINTFAQNNNGTWFFSRDTSDIKLGDEVTTSKYKKMSLPQEVVVGATLNTYVYDGNTITFVVDDLLSEHYKDRGFALFLDTGLYEDETGQVPAVSMVTLKGRAMVKAYVTGIGGIDGKTNGVASSAADSGSFEVLGVRGVQVKNPFAATIMEELI